MRVMHAASVHAAYDAWQRRDLDAVVALAHDDVEVVQDPSFPGATTATGSAALRQWLGSFFDIWDEFDLVPEEVLESGERVLVIARIHARGKGSGVEIEQKAAHLLTFDGGRVRRLETFADPAAARAAL